MSKNSKKGNHNPMSFPSYFRTLYCMQIQANIDKPNKNDRIKELIGVRS